MPGLCWMAVMLAFILFTGNSVTAVDQNKLAKIVEGIKNTYKIEGQFSLAVNIREDQDLNKLEEIFEKDPSDTVKTTVLNEEVYQGKNVVAAKFKKFDTYTEHAEARVLENIKPLTDNSKGHFLVFYSYLSPCGAKCTNTKNKFNILDKLNAVISNWKDYAFVFSTVFDKTSDGTLIDKTDVHGALERLGKSKIGHNIFRCYKPKTSNFLCINCYKDDKILDECVNNKA